MVKAGSRFRFIAALLSVLAVTVVVGALIYQTAFDTLRLTFRQLLDRSVTQGETLIDGYIQAQFSQLALYSTFPSVQHGRLDELRAGLENHGPNQPRGLAIISAAGRGVLSTGQVFEAADMPYFREALSGKRSLTGPYVSRSENLPVVVFAQPVPGNHDDAAVITSIVDLKVFRALLASIGTLSGAELTLLQDNGQRVVSSDPTVITGELIESTQRLKNVSWTLSAKVGLSDLMAPVRSVLIVVGVLVGGGAVVTIVFFLIGLRHRRSLDQVREDRTQALRDAYEQIRKLAFHDAVTRLPNRILAVRKLGEALQAQTPLVIVIVALSRFRSLTTTFGMAFGDAVLRDAAARLTTFAGPEGFVAKLGGSEFLLLLDEQHYDVGTGADLIDTLKEPMGHEGLRLQVGVHVGACRIPEAGETPDEVIKSAETAVWAAREKGHDEYSELTSDAVAHRLRRAQLQKLLPLGIERGEFEMHYQPLLDIKTNTVNGYEGLLRWTCADLGSVPPVEFIPLAEETGFILPLGYWVLEQGLSFARALAERGSEAVVSVNVSAVQFLHHGFIEEVERLVAESGVPHRNIGLEITESTLIEGVARLRPSLSRIMERGIKVSLDDFGTGYSSLNYLKELPLHVLKIDKGFIEALDSDSRALPLIDGIIQIAHRLGLAVVAEGVEAVDQLEALTSVGCDLVQGFFIGRPRPARHYIDPVTV